MPDRYFILYQKVAGESPYNDREGERLHFTSNSSGSWRKLSESPSAYFVYYRPGRASDGTSKSFFGWGRLGDVHPEDGATDSFIAEIAEYQPFPQPVPASEYEPRRNKSHSIAEISAAEFAELRRRGGVMAGTFVSAEYLQEAVTRLGQSRARPGLCDFLVLKCAMALGDGTVTLSLKDEVFMQGVRRLALAVPEGAQAVTPEPFFNPFGASREIKQGWRTKKYPSNGPPDTVSGPNWNRVIDVLSQGPRRVQFKSDYIDHLPGVVVGSDGDFPKELDIAAWFFRFEDVEQRVGTSQDETALVQAFVLDVALTPAERTVIFGAE